MAVIGRHRPPLQSSGETREPRWPHRQDACATGGQLPDRRSLDLREKPRRNPRYRCFENHRLTRVRVRKSESEGVEQLTGKSPRPVFRRTACRLAQGGRDDGDAPGFDESCHCAMCTPANSCRLQPAAPDIPFLLLVLVCARCSCAADGPGAARWPHRSLRSVSSGYLPPRRGKFFASCARQIVSIDRCAWHRSWPRPDSRSFLYPGDAQFPGVPLRQCRKDSCNAPATR